MQEGATPWDIKPRNEAEAVVLFGLGNPVVHNMVANISQYITQHGNPAVAQDTMAMLFRVSRFDMAYNNDSSKGAIAETFFSTLKQLPPDMQREIDGLRDLPGIDRENKAEELLARIRVSKVLREDACKSVYEVTKSLRETNDGFNKAIEKEERELLLEFRKEEEEEFKALSRLSSQVISKTIAVTSASWESSSERSEPAASFGHGQRYGQRPLTKIGKIR